MKGLFCTILAVVRGIPVSCIAANDDSDIEYRSLREALDDLRRQPGATLTIQGEWSAVSNSLDSRKLLWSFPQPTHYTYSAVARREVVVEDGVAVRANESFL